VCLPRFEIRSRRRPRPFRKVGAIERQPHMVVLRTVVEGAVQDDAYASRPSSTVTAITVTVVHHHCPSGCRSIEFGGLLRTSRAATVVVTVPVHAIIIMGKGGG